MLHTEHVARGGIESFQNIGGGGGGARCIYDVLTLQKSRGGGARTHLGGEKPPTPSLNAALEATIFGQ